MSDQPDFDLFGYDEPAGAPAPDEVLAALLEAGPEAAEHLLKAAQELLLAAKAVVDAGERALEAHRAAASTRADDGPGSPSRARAPASADGKAAADAAAAPDEPPRRVRRIDLA